MDMDLIGYQSTDLFVSPEYTTYEVFCGGKSRSPFGERAHRSQRETTRQQGQY